MSFEYALQVMEMELVNSPQSQLNSLYHKRPMHCSDCESMICASVLGMRRCFVCINAAICLHSRSFRKMLRYIERSCPTGQPNSWSWQLLLRKSLELECLPTRALMP
jgi:hypothetical protein